jgi:hypothetical protein
MAPEKGIVRIRDRYYRKARGLIEIYGFRIQTKRPHRIPQNVQKGNHEVLG